MIDKQTERSTRHAVRHLTSYFTGTMFWQRSSRMRSPVVDSPTKPSGPKLESIVGITLAVVGVVAIGTSGWYWLGVAAAVSVLVRNGWVNLHGSRGRPVKSKVASTARIFRRPTNIACVCGLALFLSLLIFKGGDGPKPAPSAGTQPAKSAPPTSAQLTTSRDTTTSPPSVVPDQVDASLQLFMSALGDNFKTLVFDLQDLSGSASKGPERDAPILGSWWALADWCSVNRRGTVGSCYDQASAYFQHWFERDPRAINTDTWGGAGAIAGLVVDAYSTTMAALGTPVTPTPMVPTLMAGRPGVDILCTPSCAKRIG